MQLRIALDVNFRVIALAFDTHHVFSGQTEKKEVFRALSSQISIFAPSHVPIVIAPFIMNFIAAVRHQPTGETAPFVRAEPGACSDRTC
ncbi:hypothetical protein QF000_001505 [Paraburkholderia atlantica]